MTRAMVPDDVAYTLAQVGQAANVAETLFPKSPTANSVVQDATALLDLWGVSESDEALDEVLARLHNTANVATGRANASKVWHLLRRKIEVAQAFVAAFRAQENEAAAMKRLIDEGEGLPA